MKITKTYLRQVVQEELSAVMEGVVVDFEARRKERDERKIPVRRWAQPVLDDILAIEGGDVLLDQLAADPKGEENTKGHEVLRKLGHDEQLNWVMFNVINAWKERKGEE